MIQRRWTPVLLVWTFLTVGALGAYNSMTAGAGPAAGEAFRTPDGYRATQIAAAFTAPVGVAVSDRGEVFVAESGDGTGTPPRVLRMDNRQPGRRTTVADDFPARLTAIAWHGGKLYVAYAGGVDLLDPETGLHHPVLTGLPAGGDYANEAMTFGPDDMLYLAIGTATNSGVVGLDNVARGWVKPGSTTSDIPCKDVKLRGLNYNVPNPLTTEPMDTATTGAFSPFGRTTARLQVVKGALPCTGAILRARPDGTQFELVAWGLRYPAGLAYGPDGSLYTTMQGFEERGSRPVVGDVDYLYLIGQDQWYGWPDFAGGLAITREEFQKPRFPATPLLAEIPGRPPSPVATFDHGAGAAGLLFPPQSFGLRGDALVALSNLRQVVRLNPRSGATQPFLDGPPLLRPVALAQGPRGEVYVIDSGETRTGSSGVPRPVPGTGSLLRLEPVPGRSRTLPPS